MQSLKRWPLLFSILLIILFSSYYFCTRCIYPASRNIYILTYGILCAASVLFLALYALRKNSYRYRLGTRQSWLQAHIYTGIISIVLVFMHFSFKPTGTFSIFLSVLFFTVIISGIAGSLIYLYVPLSLSKYGGNIRSEEEMTASAEKYLQEADSLISNTSEELKEIYHSKIRPRMKSDRTRWEYLLMEEKEIINKCRSVIGKCRKKVTGQDMHDLDMLGSILIKKEKLAVMQVKLGLQRIWLNFHMPLTCGLLTAVTIHIVTVMYY